MRSLILSLVIGAAALGVVAETPGQAEATWRRGFYRGGYRGGFYPRYYGGYNSVYYGGYNRSFYAAPGYGAFYTPTYRPYIPAYTYYGGPRVVYPSSGVVYYPRVW